MLYCLHHCLILRFQCFLLPSLPLVLCNKLQYSCGYIQLKPNMHNKQCERQARLWWCCSSVQLPLLSLALNDKERTNEEWTYEHVFTSWCSVRRRDRETVSCHRLRRCICIKQCNKMIVTTVTACHTTDTIWTNALRYRITTTLRR